YRLLSDERVIRYMLFPTFTIERAKTFVARLQDSGAPGQPQQLVVALESLAEKPDVVGLCGLVLRPELEEGEAWYLLRPELWGHGLTTEAVSALVEHAFRALQL